MPPIDGLLRLGMTNPIPDGLPLEYKRDYGTARRNLHLSDLVNHPAGESEGGIFSHGLPKEFFDRSPFEIGAFPEDLPNPVVVGANPVQPLK